MTSRKIPEVKSLKWLVFNFPFTESPKDEADKMCNCINLYCNNAIKVIEEQQAELNKLKALKYHLDNLCGAGIEMLGIDQQGDKVSFDEYYKSVLNEIESGS